MRSQTEFLNEYALTHRNPVNQWIHFICVPTIAFTTLGLLWAVPLGRWLGLPPELAPWVNPTTLGALPAFAFYLRLSLASALAMAVWFAASVAGIVAIQGAGLPLAAICGALWVAAWIVQLVGHNIEGAKPSFFDDLVFLLIGPLFVMQELREKLR
ncbi:MAG: DUF962 domain-containing protein [Gammaproteobacteria bacterium]|nr:DUF962 domain-containing protein [Gammaproteobacteria bacterium]